MVIRNVVLVISMTSIYLGSNENEKKNFLRIEEKVEEDIYSQIYLWGKKFFSVIFSTLVHSFSYF